MIMVTHGNMLLGRDNNVDDDWDDGKDDDDHDWDDDGDDDD